MNPLLDSFWRAAAYCLHPRVILLSILPLIVVGGVAALLGYLYWDAAVASLRASMNGWPWMITLFGWFDSAGVSGLGNLLAPLTLVVLVVPVIVVLSLLLVAMLMTPALVKLVAKQRFPQLERKHGAGFWQSALTSLGCTLIALIALVISVPFWFIPPLVLIVPPLIWGWLTYRVMGFDVLAEHAVGRRAPDPPARAPLADAVDGHDRRLPRRRAVAGLGLRRADRAVRAAARGRSRSGSTRWSSRSPRSGSRTTRWPRCRRCGRASRPARWRRSRCRSARPRALPPAPSQPPFDSPRIPPP